MSYRIQSFMEKHDLDRRALRKIEKAIVTTDEGEYIEVRYYGSQPLDLQGMLIADDGGSTPLDTSLVIDPGSLVLFARSLAGLQSCYGLIGAAEYSRGLNNGGDTVTLNNSTVSSLPVSFSAASSRRNSQTPRPGSVPALAK